MALTHRISEGHGSAQRILRSVALAKQPTMTSDPLRLQDGLPVLIDRVDTHQTTAPVFVAGNTEQANRSAAKKVSECGFGVCAHDPDCRDRLCPNAASARRVRNALVDEAVRLQREADQTSAREEMNKMDRQANQLSAAMVVGFLLLILSLASSQSIAEFVRDVLGR